MNNNSTVVIIEEDRKIKNKLPEIFKALNYKNEILFFDNSQKALDYLTNTTTIPFLIISDVDLAGINGFDLRLQVYSKSSVNIKLVPYLFFTTKKQKRDLAKLSSLPVQGFFTTPDSPDQLHETIRKIMEYWKVCSYSGEHEL